MRDVRCARREAVRGRGEISDITDLRDVRMALMNELKKRFGGPQLHGPTGLHEGHEVTKT